MIEGSRLVETSSAQDDRLLSYSTGCFNIATDAPVIINSPVAGVCVDVRLDDDDNDDIHASLDKYPPQNERVDRAKMTIPSKSFITLFLLFISLLLMVFYIVSPKYFNQVFVPSSSSSNSKTSSSSKHHGCIYHQICCSCSISFKESVALLSKQPSHLPTNISTGKPSQFQTRNPSGIPTNFPTIILSSQPTSRPTLSPTTATTTVPSELPSTTFPTLAQSSRPTISPTDTPTISPSGLPSNGSSSHPSSVPSSTPTTKPINLNNGFYHEGDVCEHAKDGECPCYMKRDDDYYCDDAWYPWKLLENDPSTDVNFGKCDLSKFQVCKDDEKLCPMRKPRLNRSYNGVIHDVYYYIDYDCIQCVPKKENCSKCSPGIWCEGLGRCVGPALVEYCKTNYPDDDF